MSFAQILLLAVGLAMDATAVAVARGCVAGGLPRSEVLWTSLLFGAAQALMPTLGWMLGASAGPWVTAIDHWIAFGVLAALGVNMLRGAAHFEQDAAGHRGIGLRVLLGLALATSIDALAVGLTLPMLRAPFVLSIVTIGVVTALLSAVGGVVGRRFGTVLGKRLDVFGGVVLIFLGCKILVEHLMGYA
ncbi:MAG: manganese efflux pump MntP family protein [Polyangiales bacterium]